MISDSKILLTGLGAAFDESSVIEKKDRTKRRRIRRWLVGHIRKIALLIINLFFNRDFVFAIIGWFNRRRFFLGSVFVAYPATEEYAISYVYPRYRHIMRWLPWPTGVFKQNGQWGLMISISSTEKDFLSRRNVENLKILVDRTEKIRQLVGATQKTFAGILPGVLKARGLVKETIETDVTVEAVKRAEANVRVLENYPADVPIIILGGKGFVGSKLLERMNGREVYNVDLNGGRANFASWPSHLRGKKAILINITRKSALVYYLGLFWPELILLNEVYPEPSEAEIEILKEIGSPAYHVVGVEADSYPSFPRAYQGGIPCCAAWNSEDMKTIVKKL